MTRNGLIRVRPTLPFPGWGYCLIKNLELIGQSGTTLLVLPLGEYGTCHSECKHPLEPLPANRIVYEDNRQSATLKRQRIFTTTQK